MRPSLGLEFLRETDLLRFFPELLALVGVPQDPSGTPRATCWVHNLMVVDEAARLRDGGPDDPALMFGALLPRRGQAADDRRSRTGACARRATTCEGVPLAAAFLERMRAPTELVARCRRMVEHHLAPALFVKNGATAKAYRRLARKLGAAGASVELLVRVARADHFGRTTEDALARASPRATSSWRRRRDAGRRAATRRATSCSAGT